MRTRPRQALFLMEFLVMLVVFALAATICLQVFAHAQAKLAAAENLRRAAETAQNTAELLRAGRAEPGFTQYFDADWNDTDAADAAFVLTASPEGSRTRVTVSHAAGGVLFELEAGRWTPDG